MLFEQYLNDSSKWLQQPLYFTQYWGWCERQLMNAITLHCQVCQSGGTVYILSVLYFPNGIFMCFHVLKCDPVFSSKFYSFIYLSLKVEYIYYSILNCAKVSLCIYKNYCLFSMNNLSVLIQLDNHAVCCSFLIWSSSLQKVYFNSFSQICVL